MMPKRLSEADLILRPDGSIYHLALRPEHLTDIVLTVGDPERVGQVSRYFDRVEEKIAHREFHTHIGYLGNQRLMVISSGMGTDNVEILMTELDALANIDLTQRTVKEDLRKLTIIRIGTSGSLQTSAPLDSLVVGAHAFGLDTLMQFYPTVMNEKQQTWAHQLREQLELSFTPYCTSASSKLVDLFSSDMLVGNTVTCPGFYAPQGRTVRLSPGKHNLLSKLSDFQFSEGYLTNLEMETAGYYALGSLLGHEVVSTNAIVAHRTTDKFSVNTQKTITVLIEKVLDVLDG